MGEKKISKNKKKRIIKTPPRHVVVFQDEQGEILKTSFVAHGEAADPPVLSNRKNQEEHYDLLFEGWDQDYTSVTSNMVLKPEWKKVPKNYLVMYYHENGSLLGFEPVAYGNAASVPYIPEKDSDEIYDYPFIGWNCDLSYIKGDTNAKAIFGKVRKIFTVRFFDEDGVLLKEEKVHYGDDSHPPVDVTKTADKEYHYEFAGWSYPTGSITQDLNIHAVFKYIYNEYTVAFYEEDKICHQEQLHYGDKISYPALKKKGYDLIWDQTIEIVEKDETIRGTWLFSNPVNKIIETDEGVFQITNPSVHHGEVKCLKYYNSGERKVIMPSEIRLGDYYYRIREIGAYALKPCTEMRELILPDNLRRVEDRGLAKCRNLKKVYFGRQLYSLGKEIFAGDQRLETVVFTGKDLKKVSGKCIAGISARVEITGKGGKGFRNLKKIPIRVDGVR